MSKVYFPTSMPTGLATIVSGLFSPHNAVSKTETDIHTPLVISLPQNTSLILLRLSTMESACDVPWRGQVFYTITDGTHRYSLGGSSYDYVSESECVLKNFMYLSGGIYQPTRAYYIRFVMSADEQTLSIYADALHTNGKEYVGFKPCAAGGGGPTGIYYTAYIFA